MYFGMALILIIGYLFVELRISQTKSEKLEQKINLQDNNYGSGSQLLKSEIKDPRIDSLLKANSIKPKNVDKLISVTYSTTNHFGDTTIVANGDTSKCIEYNHKGVSISGCKGSYELTENFNATGILNRKPTKKFLFIKYRKKPVLQAWTAWGDTLQIKLVEK